MKVLFLYPRSLDAGKSVGGVAEVLCSLTPALKDLDVDSVIYANDKNAKQLSKPSHTLAATTVYYAPFAKPGWWLSRKKISHAMDVCRLENIDLIHAKGTYTAGFMALKIYERTGIPYIVTSHSDILTTNSRRMNRWGVRRRCCEILKHAAAVTHLTPIMEEFSHELFDTRSRSVVIGNGIDVKSWQAFASLPERNYMLGIGRLVRGKGFHILIEMLARLIAQGMKTSLIIAGKGSEEEALVQQARELGLACIRDFSDFSTIPEKSVIFTGYVRDDVKKRLIAESQIVLFVTQPQLWEEAFGMVQLEAMAVGRPILASDTRATRFLEKAGMQCRIAAPTDVADWVQQAECLLQDAGLRKRMGQANLQAVKQFEWQSIAKKYRDVYQLVRNSSDSVQQTPSAGILEL